MFNIATIEVSTVISSDHVNLYTYADGMAIVSELKEELQKAFDKLIDWADANYFQINCQRATQMVFRKGAGIQMEMNHWRW